MLGRKENNIFDPGRYMLLSHVARQGPQRGGKYNYTSACNTKVEFLPVHRQNK